MKIAYRTVIIFLVTLFVFGTGFAPASPPETFKVAFIGPDRNLYTWTSSRSSQMIYAAGDLSDLRISGDGSRLGYDPTYKGRCVSRISPICIM